MWTIVSLKDISAGKYGIRNPCRICGHGNHSVENMTDLDKFVAKLEPDSHEEMDVPSPVKKVFSTSLV